MATVTHRASTPNTAAGNSYTSDAFTPAVGDVLVVFAVFSGAVGTGTCTSSRAGFTFTQVNTALKATSADQLYCFVSDAAVTSATSQTVTATITGTAATGATIFVASVAGLVRTGTGAVRQSAVNSNVAAATTMTATFSQAALTSNPVLAFIGLARNPAAMTPPSGFTEQADTGYATPTQGQEYATVDSGFTGSVITWGNAHLGSSGCIAVEMDASAGTPLSASGSGATAGSAAIAVLSPLYVTATGTGATGGSAAVTAANLPVTNLIPNPSFETDTTGWVGNGSNITRDATHGGVSGSWACKAANIGGQAGVQSASSLFPAVTAGSTYTFSAHAYKETGSTANPITLNVLWYDAGLAFLSQNANVASVTTFDAWTRMFGTLTAPANAASCRVSIQLDAVVTFWVDALMLTEGGTLFDYFDGSTTGPGYTYAWAGTPDASTSTRTAVVGTSYALTASGSGTTGGSAAVTGETTLSGAGTGLSGGSAAFTRQTTLTATGNDASGGAAALTGTLKAAASGSGATTGTATLTRQTSLAATGTGATSGSAAPILLTNAGLSASGTGRTAGGAAFTLSATITATGTEASSGAATLTRQTTITATGTGATTGTAALIHDLGLAATGTSTSGGAVDSTMEYGLSASGTGTVAGTAVLGTTVPLSAAGASELAGDAALAVLLALTADGANATSGTAVIGAGQLRDIHVHVTLGPRLARTIALGPRRYAAQLEDAQ